MIATELAKSKTPADRNRTAGDFAATATAAPTLPHARDSIAAPTGPSRHPHAGAVKAESHLATADFINLPHTRAVSQRRASCSHNSQSPPCSSVGLTLGAGLDWSHRIGATLTPTNDHRL